MYRIGGIKYAYRYSGKFSSVFKIVIFIIKISKQNYLPTKTL